MAFQSIYTIDTGFVRPRFDAAYLLVHKGHGAFIDCGTNYAVPHMLETLKEAKIEAAQVDWLILTHVHLDHAGGAGELMAKLPNARLAVHPRGARHMIDPSQLWAGALAVYGKSVMEQAYGYLRPVVADRVVEAPDGYTVDLGGRLLRCLDTPGHAKHHMAIHDLHANVCFTGDTFGLSYREFDTDKGPFILPTTTPVQFDPKALHASIDRLIALKPTAIYVTHYGRLEDLDRLAHNLHEMIETMVAVAQKTDGLADRHVRLVEELTELYTRSATAHGWNGDCNTLLHWLGMDIELNAQGLGVWLDRGRS